MTQYEKIKKDFESIGYDVAYFERTFDGYKGYFIKPSHESDRALNWLHASNTIAGLEEHYHFTKEYYNLKGDH